MSDVRKKTILLVEDDPELRKTETRFFERSHFKVITADNGLEALKRCENQRFDAILCDITMPKMTGDRAISIIRQSDQNRNTPIFVLSGHLDIDVVSGLKGKITKAFTKPADLEEVVKFVETTLNLKKVA